MMRLRAARPPPVEIPPLSPEPLEPSPLEFPPTPDGAPPEPAAPENPPPEFPVPEPDGSAYALLQAPLARGRLHPDPAWIALGQCLSSSSRVSSRALQMNRARRSDDEHSC